MVDRFDEKFRERYFGTIAPRSDDDRDEYARDNARIIHSAGFRRLQGKTQVMGVGEGDFHRTRLTHSIEAAQIGTAILKSLTARHKHDLDDERWLPSTELVIASCFAHDIGHPPFGHGGERALHKCMIGNGGFEGNAQTLRILTKLEKYSHFEGINPTRRTILSVLKYPVCYDRFRETDHEERPPKCYYKEEQKIVDWALKKFSRSDRTNFTRLNDEGKACHRTFDASIMECADDIAYAVHDLEDIVGRQMIPQDALRAAIEDLMKDRPSVGVRQTKVTRDDFANLFLSGGEGRKSFIGKLVHLLIADVYIKKDVSFKHPLLRFNAGFREETDSFLRSLKQMVSDLVISRAELQQLERRGQRLVDALFNEFVCDPKRLIPRNAWESLDPNDTKERRVCDYIAGMTDPFAERIYQRLFTPGFGSSRDEL